MFIFDATGAEAISTIHSIELSTKLELAWHDAIIRSLKMNHYSEFSFTSDA